VTTAGAFLDIALVTTAGAFLDIAADSYAVDATPPEWHGRVLGTASRLGRVIGGSLASLIPPILLNMGSYKLVFLALDHVYYRVHLLSGP